MASFRAAIAGLTVFALVPAARHGRGRPAALVAIPYTATALLFVLSNKMTTAASAILLQSTSPLYIALLGPSLLREKTRRRDLAFMAVLAAGLALVLAGTRPPARTAPRPALGNALALGCGFTVAVMMMRLRFPRDGGEDTAAGRSGRCSGAVEATSRGGATCARRPVPSGRGRHRAPPPRRLTTQEKAGANRE